MYELVSAIKDLRARLGETQQAFANRLGLSVSAIANYEAGRRPTVSVLFALTAEASKSNNEDLSNVFSAAYASTMRGVTDPVSDEETAWVRMVLALVRNKRSVSGLQKLGTDLLGALEALAAGAEGTTLMTEPDELNEAVEWARRHITPSAELQIWSLAKERSKRTGETVNQAFAAVLAESPDLHKGYLAELAARYGVQPEEITIAKPTQAHRKHAREENGSPKPRVKRRRKK